MTDRAKRISQLQTTSSVANTDKIVVLKDAANTSAASTRAMTVNAFAQSIKPLVQDIIPNTTVVGTQINVASNNTSYVPFYVYNVPANKTGCLEVRLHARDGNNITAGQLFVAINATTANIVQMMAIVGDTTIDFDNAPLVNTTANTVTLYMRRGANTTNNVSIRYVATIF